VTDVLLAIGTRKGLFFGRSKDGRATWDLTGPTLLGEAVYAVGIDTRRGTPRLLAGADSSHWGPSVLHSDDLGATWDEPEYAPARFPERTGAALARVWQLRPGPAAEPDLVWAGSEPAALWRSTDGGVSYELVEPLWDHPTREHWMPGAGGQCLHTVLPHPTDADRVLIAVSTGGVYQTVDGGKSWEPTNSGIGADFMPGPPPEFGQCVHKVAMHSGRPEQLFLQNHGGVYRSDDGGRSWSSIAAGLPADFGFPIVAHPHRPGTAYVFPLVADVERLPPERRCRVYRSGDAGESWEALTDGLPQERFHTTVLRDSMCTDEAEPAGVYFGTRSGEVWVSRDDGDSWRRIAEHLPDVLCVRAAVLS
jgi:photosystem II stability/assembly factor-like uncharacterized protein